MDTSNSNQDIQTWLQGLESAESKRHETIAQAIARNPVYDERIVFALKRITRQDPQAYARDAARKALEEIAQAHFAAGNDIRTYLEQLRQNPYLRQQTEPQKPPTPQPAAIVPPSPTVTADVISTASQPIAAAPARAVQAVQTPPPAPKVVTPPAPAEPPIPFDQWLLSERNIKFALYSGGFLLILAGLIFVGVNWQYLPGIAKLAVTLAVTAGMYVGGVLLFRRPSLKIGGTALLAIASGFLPLNFVVSQLYLLNNTNIPYETQWLVASLVCGGVYAVTALRTRHAIFSVFMAVALVSATSMAVMVLRLSGSWIAIAYVLMTIGLMALAYFSATRGDTKFQARPLRIFAHVCAVLVSLGLVVLAGTTYTYSPKGDAWLALGGLALMGVLYAVDDWHKKSLYARWSAAVVFGLVVMLLCTRLDLSIIQTGIVLKITAAGYLLLGNLLQRNKTLRAGLPLYTVSAALAALVTAQAAFVFGQTPEHLGLAMAADVVLLALATYLSRQVEFAYGAVLAALVPVWIFGNLWLADSLQRALAFAVVMVLYTAVGLRLGLKQWRWALPFLSTAVGLSVLVPVLLYPQVGVIAAVLLGIGALYALTAVRFNQPLLVFPAIAAVNLALVSAANYFVPVNFDLARVLVWAFGAWAVILFFVRRALLYVRLNEWADPLHIGAIGNFALTYVMLVGLVILDIGSRSGSQTAVFTLLQLVGLLALTYWLYRQVGFLYLAVFVAILPVYLQARLLLVDAVRVGLVMGALMVVYAAVGVALGVAQDRNKRAFGAAGAFLLGAAVSSVVAAVVLYPNYAVLAAMLLGITALYAFFAVWLRWHWLTIAAVFALDFAILMGVRSAFQFTGDLQQMSGLGLTAAGVALIGIGVWLKLRGWAAWRVPLYVGAGVNLLLGYTLVMTHLTFLGAAVSAAVAAVCFVMQWVEREELTKLKLPPVLSYVGAAVLLFGIYALTQALQLPVAYGMVALAVGGFGLMGVSWYLERLQQDAPAKPLYGEPLWFMGVLSLGTALVLLIPMNNALAGALGYGVAAVALGLEAWFRKNVWFAYASGAAIVATLWWLLRYFDVREIQAFVIPLGILSLLIGWNELRIGRRLGFQLATVFGLVLLMGSAFYQSLGNVNYAVMLLVESIIAFGVGVRMRSRFYVEAAILALFGNGLVQFGPALVDLPRWVQIGAIGSILVTGGLLALFRRQRLLEMRSAFTNQWKMWKP